MSHAAIDQARFRQVLGHFPTGVTVITSEHGGERVGLAVGSFFSISLEPALVGFCAGHQSSSWPRIREAGRFCVNILGEHQEDVCRTFAGRSDDKFAGVGYDAAPFSGAPRIHDVLAWVDCELDSVVPAGDHDIVIGRVHDLQAVDGGGPLVFFRGGYASLGR
ncbi:MAG: flavin reductase family protein [Acidimicrobiales bacterium]|nr:flavin reductase family protein [Acidimicrobiales bacterium]